jgi:hypothetical protein
MNLLIVAIIGLFIFILPVFGLVAFRNSESQSIVFTFSAAVGAVVMFLLTLFLELRSTSETHVIQTQITINHERPEAGQWDYPRSSGKRRVIDKTASDWLATNNPDIFKSDPSRVLKDLLFYSLVGFFACEVKDWQMIHKYFITGRTSHSRDRDDMNDSDEFIPRESFKSILDESENLFAGVEFNCIAKGVILPSGTRLSLAGNSLLFTNEFCEIIYEVDESSAFWYVLPGRQQARYELMQDGSPKYETTDININIHVKYMGMRAKSRTMTMHKEWIERLVKRSRMWFEINQDESKDS